MKVLEMIRNTAFFAAIASSMAASSTQAAFTGTMGVVDFGTAINTLDLGTATTYTFGGLQNNANVSGDFAPVPSGSPFGSGSFTLGSATSLTFSNPDFGTFIETTAPVETATSIVSGITVGRTFYILGTYTPGASLGGGGPIDASFTVSFTQTGGPNTAVSASGTVSIPPSGAVVPEPASIAMLGLGLAGLAGVAYRRRSAN